MNNPSESIQAYLRTIGRCGQWFCYRSAIELSMNWYGIHLSLKWLEVLPHNRHRDGERHIKSKMFPVNNYSTLS